MRLLTHRATAALALLTLAGGMSACGNPIDAALDFGLEGTWKGIDGLAIEFDGNQAVVTDFGSSSLGTNSSVFHTGQPFVKDIACDESGCTGQIVDPEIVNGILQSVGFEGVTIETNGDQITMRRTASGEASTFTKVSTPGGGTGGTLSLDSCEGWREAFAAKGTWKVTEWWVSDGLGNLNDAMASGVYSDYTLQFTGTTLVRERFTTHLNGSTQAHDQTSDAPATMLYGDCRVATDLNLGPLFARSLSGGTAVLASGTRGDNPTGRPEPRVKLEAQ
jgi:hypothetical protein